MAVVGRMMGRTTGGEESAGSGDGCVCIGETMMTRLGVEMSGFEADCCCITNELLLLLLFLVFLLLLLFFLPLGRGEGGLSPSFSYSQFGVLSRFCLDISQNSRSSLLTLKPSMASHSSEEIEARYWRVSSAVRVIGCFLAWWRCWPF